MARSPHKTVRSGRLVDTNWRLQAKLARRFFRRIQQMLRYQHWSLRGIPVLFANSFPKSGTHLLTQILQGFPRIGPAVDSGLPSVVTFDGDSGRQRAIGEVLRDLGRFLPGDVGYGHLHAFPEFTAFLQQSGYAAYFILRDPRDVVISHVHYVTDLEPRHVHHAYFHEQLENFDQRLEASICGFTEAGVTLPNVRQRFEPFFGWLDAAGVMTLHYETLLQERESELARIVDHAVRRGFSLSCSEAEAVRILAANIDPLRSPTFRRGKAGGWRDQFTPLHKQLFKEISGDLLIRLGYERNNDW